MTSGKGDITTNPTRIKKKIRKKLYTTVWELVLLLRVHDKFQERHRLPQWHKKKEKVLSVMYL